MKTDHDHHYQKPAPTYSPSPFSFSYTHPIPTPVPHFPEIGNPKTCTAIPHLSKSKIHNPLRPQFHSPISLLDGDDILIPLLLHCPQTTPTRHDSLLFSRCSSLHASQVSSGSNGFAFSSSICFLFSSLISARIFKTYSQCGCVSGM